MMWEDYREARKQITDARNRGELTRDEAREAIETLDEEYHGEARDVYEELSSARLERPGRRRY